MTKKYSWFGILLVLTQPYFLQISSINADSADLFTIDAPSNDVIDSFYYSMYKASAWTGYYKLEAWFSSNQTVHIKYALKASTSINLSEGEGSKYFLYVNEFDKNVQGGNWDYYANLIRGVNNWNYDTYMGQPMCDGGIFIKEIKLYKSGSEVKSSIHRIDRESCSGKDLIPQNSNVIILMEKIHDYLLELVESNQLTASDTQICTPAFNVTFFILSVFVLSLILNKRRS